MAKKKAAQPDLASNDALVGFAEDLGRLLGTAQVNAERWLNQRSEVTNTLIGIRDTASRLLADLGTAAESARARGRKVASSAAAAYTAAAPAAPRRRAARATPTKRKANKAPKA